MGPWSWLFQVPRLHVHHTRPGLRRGYWSDSVRSKFLRQHCCRWSRRDMLVGSVLVYINEASPVRIREERWCLAMTACTAFGRSSEDIGCPWWNCSVAFVAHFCQQRRLHDNGYPTRRQDGELMRDLLLPSPHRSYSGDEEAIWRLC